MIPLPKTYMCLPQTKKLKFVFQGWSPKKFNGGGGKLKTHKKPYFFHLTEISGQFFRPGWPKIGQMKIFGHGAPQFSWFLIWIKRKKL